MTNPRRPRSLGIEAIIQNKYLFSMFHNAVGIPYAGDEPNPRLMSEISLYEYKKGLYLNQEMLTSTWHVPNAMYFSFADKKYSWDMKDVITVATEQLWDMIMPGDTVLLTDYVTHHYTGILAVDREKQRIYFSDPWPDRFFLKAGLNTADVEADDRLSITREEFLRVIVGLVTLDNPDLPLYYLNQNPEQYENTSLLRRIGLAILDEGRDRLVDTAAQYLVRAYNLSLQSRDEKELLATAAEAYLALTIASNLSKTVPLACKPFQDKLNQIVSKLNENDLLALLKAEDLGRIAYTSGVAGEYEDSEKYFDFAIEKNPQHEYNLYLRAKARFINGKYQGTIQDIEQSLLANSVNQEQTRNRLDARDPRDRFGIGRDKATIASLQQQIAKSLSVRCKAYISTGQLDLADKDADTIIQQQLQQPEGYLLRSQIAKSKKDWSAALEYMKKASSLETEPSKQAFYSMEIAHISQSGETA